MSFCPPWYFWLIAASVAIFHGIYGFLFERTSRDRGNPQWRRVLLCFQTWFNFAGSAMGWIAGYGLYVRFTAPGDKALGTFDVLLGLTAALGITGHLPMLLAGIAATPALLAEYMRRRLGA